MIQLLADDLSGACECASILADHGHSAPVCFDRPTCRPGGRSNPEAPEQGPAVVVDLNARQLDGAAASRKVRDCLADRRAAFTYFKIDSAFRGPIGPMLLAAKESLGAPRVLICCAVPETRRWTVGGIQLVNGIPLSQSAFAGDPTHPREESHLPSLLAAQIHDKVMTVAPGVVAESWREGLRWAIADAESAGDLRVIAEGWKNEGFAAGASGLWRALLNARFGPPRARPGRRVLGMRRPLIVSGSISPMSRAQMRYLAGRFPQLDILDAPRESMEPARATAQIVEQAAGRLAGGGYDGLLISGGYTARSLLEALNVNCLMISGSLLSAVAVGRAFRANEDPLNVVIKPGSYGGVDVYERILGAGEGSGRA